jgi:hypothetical protein
MVRLNFIFTIFITLLISVSPTYSEIELSVKPQDGSIDEIFSLSLLIKSDSLLEKPKVITNDNFELVGQSQKSQVSIINGNVSQEITYQFNFQALKVGELKLPDIEIRTINGKVKKSSPTVKVTASDDQTQNNSDKESNRLAFYQAVSELEVYQGEQFLNGLRLTSPNEIVNLELDTLNFENFWAEKLGEDSVSSKPTKSGMSYIFNSKRSLYALKEGELELPTRSVNVTILKQNRVRDPFDLFSSFSMLGGSPQSLKLNSNSLKIKVRKMPVPVPKSATSWGNTLPLVGKTSLEFEPDNSTIEIGKQKTYQLKLRSFGNANPIKKLPLIDNPMVKIYEEPLKVRKALLDNKLEMTLTFNFSIVPIQSGEVFIEPFRLSYFDTESQSFKELETKAIRFTVTDGNNTTPQNSISIPKEETNNNQEKPAILEYQEQTYFEKIKELISINMLLWLGFCIISLYVIFRIFQNIRKKSLPLKYIKKELNSSKDPNQLKEALFKLIQFKTGLAISSYSCSQVAQVLKYQNIEPATLLKLQNLLDQLEHYQYSPEKHLDSANFNKLKTNALEIYKILC